MPHASQHPKLNIPTNLTTWEWLFDSPFSIHARFLDAELKSFYNPVTKERLHYRDIKKLSSYVSTALVKQHGLEIGDTVAMFSNNSIWYPLATFATLRAGAVISGASPAYNASEMTYALKTSAAKFLFTLPSSLDVALEAAGEAGICQSRIFLLEGDVQGFLTMQDLIHAGRAVEQTPKFVIPAGKQSKDVCGYLNFSSGTTGLPKAVMISHGNVISQTMQIAQHVQASQKDNTILAVLPAFHITGLVALLQSPVHYNREVVILPKFEMKLMLDMIASQNIREMWIVPPLLIRLLNDPLVDGYDLSRFHRFNTGSAPLAPEIINALAVKYPHIGIRQGYGMTESTGCLTCTSPGFYDWKYAHTVGKICANTILKVVDLDTGKELGTNETGEIMAQGPQVVMGYLNNPTATAESFEGGWLHTGDIGFLDEEGLLHISDRLKEMIKVKGIQIAPAELEDHLLGHPAVADVAVIGIPDSYSGEVPKAFVVLKEKYTASKDMEEELKKYVSEKKFRAKWITGGVEFVEVIPKSPTGKILRRILRDVEKAKVEQLKAKL